MTHESPTHRPIRDGTPDTVARGPPPAPRDPHPAPLGDTAGVDDVEDQKCSWITNTMVTLSGGQDKYRDEGQAEARGMFKQHIPMWVLHDACELNRQGWTVINQESLALGPTKAITQYTDEVIVSKVRSMMEHCASVKHTTKFLGNVSLEPEILWCIWRCSVLARGHFYGEDVCRPQNIKHGDAAIGEARERSGKLLEGVADTAIKSLMYRCWLRFYNVLSMPKAPPKAKKQSLKRARDDAPPPATIVVGTEGGRAVLQRDRLDPTWVVGLSLCAQFGLQPGTNIARFRRRFEATCGAIYKSVDPEVRFLLGDSALGPCFCVLDCTPVITTKTGLWRCFGVALRLKRRRTPMNFSGKYVSKVWKLEYWTTLGGIPIAVRGAFNGCTHDAKIFRDSDGPPFRHYEGEYFLGDSGYQGCRHCVVPD
ncbi:Hypothetical protein, putative [Bodo saltans]|uniref:DDE Tnp4 domain-containing protein n=1 Tax=Bodo saltans TaxID=75058 RepID=A0A0S4IJU2_BODSA|nr:Hypothetical protein, putative [Bodo saltans]|eukprot:CUE59663.1 Hypothetical protein, putative [Bodo saltans]